MRPVAPAAVLVALALALACAPREPRPDVAYRAFARAVADREAERAWSLLSSDTRSWLDARARAAAQAAPGVVPASGKALLLGSAAAENRPIASILVVRESRDAAVVAVAEAAAGGAPREVELVREGGWRVRLPAPR